MNRPLVLVGGGGHCRSVIEAAESAGFRIHGILDMPQYIGDTCLGYKVIGCDNDIPLYAAEYDFAVTLGHLGNPRRRIMLHRMIAAAGGRLATIVASTARVSSHSGIGEGTVVLHQAVVNANARIGRGCIINTSAVIEHDCIVGDWNHVSTGVLVNGGCCIGDSCFIGSGTVLKHGIRVTGQTIIGASSLVTKEITIPGTYYGVPANKK